MCFSVRLLSAAVVSLGLLGCTAPLLPGVPGVQASGFLPPEPPSGYTPKTIAFAQRDMVAAAHPLAVQAGVNVLAQGGSAVDAATAVQMVLGVVEPQSSGIGGGAFLLHFDRGSGQVQALDGRETAPAAATPDMFLGADGKPLPFTQAVDGGLSVGTPGVLRMLALAHAQHGKLPWAHLFDPAIALAEGGFAVSPRLHASVAAMAPRIRAQGGSIARHFLTAQGKPLPVGTLLRNPELADTLRRVAQGGADAFYRGDIAADVVATVRQHPTRPGHLALADLEKYVPKIRPAACGVYKVRYRICGMPAPSSGGTTVLQTLALLERFDLGTLDPTAPHTVHLVSEAYRLAYADRARYVADPDFVPVPQAGLLDAAYLRQRAGLIDLSRSLGAPSAGQPPGAPLALGHDASPELPSTSHISVVDAAGNAVSMTTTIESAFGSLQMVRGFLLNNQLTDFSFVPTDASGPVANRVEPGKRPRSSMAPTLVFNANGGELEAVLGSPGGSAIIQYVTRALLGLIDWRLDIQEAVNLPHFGAQTGPVTAIEQGSVLDTSALRQALTAQGHQVVVTPQFTSGLHGIVFNGQRADGSWGLLARHPGKGQWAGGADPRREGMAAGTR